MKTTSTITALASLLAVASAAPAAQEVGKPYFSVTGFSFSRTETAARYALNVSFPKDVLVSNVPGDQATYVVPGFTDAVACTGTYFFAGGSEYGPHITPINACGSPSDRQKSVTTKLDVVTGELFLTYTLNSTSAQSTKLYTYTGSQTGLTPVDPSAAESFNTPATSGPGIDQ